jgi:acyl carrier protein
MSDTLEEVKNVIAEIMKIDTSKITLETRFIEDLKADSMDQFLLIDEFSKKFSVEIKDDDARLIKTVGDAVTQIEKGKK